MKKAKIEYIVTAAFAVVLVFILVKSAFGPKPKKTVVSRPAAAQEASLPGAGADAPQAAGWGRDPFSFGKATYATAEQGMALNGIVWDEKAPSAIINDTIVRVGEEINGKRVMDIQKNKVTLSAKDGNIYELNLAHELSR